MEEFIKLGLSENTIRALVKKGFTTPTTIQSQVIPLLLKGEKDVIGQSQTGTGKTASFGLPILERIEENSKTVQAIILTPTRELAMQVAGEIISLKGDKKVHIISVYGGSAIDPQIKDLRRGVDIVVGTPGRVKDLQKRGVLKLNNIKYAVLDEADEMLNMGFVDDIKEILEKSPKEKTMLLFSATMPKPILKIAKEYMREHEIFEVEKSQVTVNTVEQIYYNISAKDRIEGIRRIIDYYVDFYGIIFCNTKSSVDTVAHKLAEMNYNAAAIHGDITQSQREKILQDFRNKKITILVATDVAARGIDVTNLSHVVNFSLPQSPETYVHRIGRTGRAGNKGISVTFVIPSESRKLGMLERINNCKLEKHTLPSAKDVIAHKEEQVKTIIKDMLENSGKTEKYEAMAKELLDIHEPLKVVSAILKYSFKHDLDSIRYKDISEPAPSRGGSRGSGRSDREGYSARDRPKRDGPRRDSRGGDRRGGDRRGGGDRGNFRSRDGARSDRPKRDGDRSSYKPREGSSQGGDRPVRAPRDGARSFDKPRGDRPARSFEGSRERSPRPSSDRSRSDRPNRSPRDGARSFEKPRSDRAPRDGAKPSFNRGERSSRSGSDKPRSDRPARSPRSDSDKPRGEKRPKRNPR